MEDENGFRHTPHWFNWADGPETGEEGDGGGVSKDSLGLDVARGALKGGVNLVFAEVAEVALVEGIERGLTLCASEYTVSLVRVGEGFFSSLFDWGEGVPRPMVGGGVYF